MFPTFISILDIQSWWEVPSIAHFCSLFRSAFNLLDFDIEDLEEALLADGTEDNSWLQVLIVRLLSGCLPNNEISTFNYQMFLRRLFRQKCQEYELLHNPFNTDTDFQLLPLRTKVDILQALCDFRLDSEDVLDLLKNLEADSLRVEPLGYDSNNSAYWYFYGTRLYREDFPKGTSAKHLGASINFKKPPKPSVWQVVCFTEEDWFQLAKKLSKSKARLDRQLHSTISENFLPELSRLFKEKERLKRNRLFDNFPRRSSRIKEQEDHDVEQAISPSNFDATATTTHIKPPTTISNNTSDDEAQHERCPRRNNDDTELIDLVDSEDSVSEKDDVNSVKSLDLGRKGRYAEDSMAKAKDKDKQQHQQQRDKKGGGKDGGGRAERRSRRGEKHRRSDGETDDGRESRNTKSTDTPTKLSRSSRSNKDRDKSDKSRDKSSRGDKSSSRDKPSHKSSRDDDRRHKSDKKDKSEDRSHKSDDKSSARKSGKHKSSKNVGGDAPTALSVGRQTNNSLASATGQIVIQSVSNPLRKKMKTSQVFSQSDEDLQVGMHKIMDYVKDHEDAWPFVDPVEEEYAPNYYSIIRRPMDLQRMEERLENGSYTNFSKFKGDFQLIVNNCRLYNGVDNEYTEMVDNLLHTFERATERYLDQITSSDDEIAVEYREDRKKSKGHKRKYREHSPSPIPAKRKPTLAAQADKKRDSQSDSDEFIDEEKAKKIVTDIREKKHKKRSKIEEDEVLVKKNKANDENKKSKRLEEDVKVKKSKKGSSDEEISPKKSKLKERQEEEPVINKKRSKTLDVEEEPIKSSKKHSKSSRNDKLDKRETENSTNKNDNKKHKKAKESPTENGKRKKQQLSDVTHKAENVIPDKEEREKKKPGRKPKNKTVLSTKVNKSKDNKWNSKSPHSSPDRYKHLFTAPKGDKKDAFAFSSDEETTTPKVKKNAKTAKLNSKKENNKNDILIDTKIVDKKSATIFGDKTKDAPVKHKDKHNKLRETIEMLKAKNDIKTPYDFDSDKTKENIVENIKKGSDKKVSKPSKNFSSNNIVKDSKEFDFDDHSSDSFDSKKKKAATFHTKSNDTIDALALATEQTLKDINKWLDDTPRFPDFSSNSNSPTHFSNLDEFDTSGGKFEEKSGGKVKEEKKEKQAAPLLAPPPKPEPVPTKKELALAAKLEMQKKKAAAAKEKVPKKREVQRTIDRLQPGKSKGNLITNVPTTNKPADELFHNFAKKDTKNSLIVKTDDSAPKLSLGSVLDSFGEHKFIDDPKKEGEDEETEKKKDDSVLTKDSTVKITDGKEDLVKKLDMLKEETKKVESKVENDKQIIGHSPGKATPNLSAWFKAFGAPKVPSAPQQPATTESTPTSVIASTTTTKLNSITRPITANNHSPTTTTPTAVQQQPTPTDSSFSQPQQQQQVVSAGGATPGSRTRKISTGSSVSERSSFSQDMDSPRVGLDERGGGGYPAPYPSPLHQSPSGASPSLQSPRADVSPRAAAYPASFNGQIRVGFYQDTVVSAKSSPDKSCSPRDPQSPYAQYGAEHVYTPPQANGASGTAGGHAGINTAGGYSSYNNPYTSYTAQTATHSPTAPQPAPHYSTALTPTPPYNNNPSPASPNIAQPQQSPSQQSQQQQQYQYTNPGSTGSAASSGHGKATPTGSNSSRGGTPQHYSMDNSNSPATPQELVIGSAPGTPQSGMSGGAVAQQMGGAIVGQEGYGGMGSGQGTGSVQQGDISPYGGRDTNSSSGGSQRIVDEFSQEPTDMVLEQSSKPDIVGTNSRDAQMGGGADMEIETYQGQGQSQHSPSIKRASKQHSSILNNDQFQLDTLKSPNVNPFRQHQQDITNIYRHQQQVGEATQQHDKQQLQLQQRQQATSVTAMFPVKKRAYNEQNQQQDDLQQQLSNHQQHQPNYMDMMIRQQQQQQLEQPAMQVSPNTSSTTSSTNRLTPNLPPATTSKYITQNIPDPRNTATTNLTSNKDQPLAPLPPTDPQQQPQNSALRGLYSNYYSNYPLNIPSATRTTSFDHDQRGAAKIDMSKYTNMGYTGSDGSASYGAYTSAAAASGYKALSGDGRVSGAQQQQQTQYGAVRADADGMVGLGRYGGVDVSLGRNLATLSQIVDRYPGDLSTAPISSAPPPTLHSSASQQPVPAHSGQPPSQSYYSHTNDPTKQQQPPTSSMFSKAVAATVAGSLAPAFMANSMVYSRNIAAAAAAAAAAGAMYGGRVPSQQQQQQQGNDMSATGQVLDIDKVQQGEVAVPVVKRGRKKKVKNGPPSTSSSASSTTSISNLSPSLPSATQQQQQQGFQSYTSLKASSAIAAAAAAAAGIEPPAISLKTASVGGVPGSAFNFGPTPTGLGVGMGDASGGYGSLVFDEFSRAAGWYGAGTTAGGLVAAAAHHSRTAQRSTPDPIAQTTQPTTVNHRTTPHHHPSPNTQPQHAHQQQSQSSSSANQQPPPPITSSLTSATSTAASSLTSLSSAAAVYSSFLTGRGAHAQPPTPHGYGAALSAAAFMAAGGAGPAGHQGVGGTDGTGSPLYQQYLQQAQGMLHHHHHQGLLGQSAGYGVGPSGVGHAGAPPGYHAALGMRQSPYDSPMTRPPWL